MIADTTSYGCPIREIGCIDSDERNAISFPVIGEVKGVSMSQGATQLTRIPLVEYVAAADNVSPMTPALVALIASW